MSENGIIAQHNDDGDGGAFLVQDGVPSAINTGSAFVPKEVNRNGDVVGITSVYDSNSYTYAYYALSIPKGGTEQLLYSQKPLQEQREPLIGLNENGIAAVVTATQVQFFKNGAYLATVNVARHNCR